jgi:hypothetical protein
MIAGFVAAVVTSPVDVIKTRIMNQKVGTNGELLYRGTLDCLVKVIRTEGMIGLYKGFFPNWMRIGPHTVVVSFFPYSLMLIHLTITDIHSVRETSEVVWNWSNITEIVTTLKVFIAIVSIKLKE